MNALRQMAAAAVDVVDRELVLREVLGRDGRWYDVLHDQPVWTVAWLRSAAPAISELDMLEGFGEVVA